MLSKIRMQVLNSEHKYIAPSQSYEDVDIMAAGALFGLIVPNLDGPIVRPECAGLAAEEEVEAS